jgi:hypothetical protein
MPDVGTAECILGPVAIAIHAKENRAVAKITQCFEVL